MLTVTGLENNYICAHRPIPVVVSEDDEDVRYIEVVIYDDSNNQLAIFRADLSTDRKAFIDLSPWIKMCMPKFLTNLTYGIDIISEDWEYIREFDIRFKSIKDDGSSTVPFSKTFVHCYNNKVLLTDNNNVRAWEGFPFSVQCGNQIAKGIPFDPVDVEGRCVEYIRDTGCCGTYIKWLNEYGFFNYWMFPNRTIESEADELFRVNRDIFESNQNAPIDTVGFEPKTTYKLKDLIPKAYWNLFNSLVSSPEVYLFRSDWNVGENLIAGPMDWTKVIQEFKFERDTIRRNMVEVEVKLEVPLLSYSQKRI